MTFGTPLSPAGKAYRVLAALGVLPSLFLAAFGFYALRRDADLSHLDARAQAATLAQAAADAVADAALSVPLPSVADVEAWIARPGPPESDPLFKLRSQRPGLNARLVAPRGTYPRNDFVPVAVTLPDSGSDPGRALEMAIRTEASGLRSSPTTFAWQAALDLAEGQPAGPILRFRLASALARQGQVAEARRLLESLVAHPLDIAGETGLPLDVLVYRALAQIADSDPASASEAVAWGDALAQRVLVRWHLPESLLVGFFPPAWPRLERWREVARLHAEVAEAFREIPPPTEPTPTALWSPTSNEPTLVSSHPVDGGQWQLRWPDSTRREIVARLESFGLPEHLAATLRIAERPLTPTQAGRILSTASAARFPGLSVTLHLERPEFLDSRVRRRTLALGILLLLATLTTAGSYLAALRAFRRQRELATRQRDFVAAVSHELRAPLAAVRLLAEELIDLRDVEAPKRDEYARLILREAGRLGRLVDNVLRHARQDRPGPALEPRPIDLTDLVSRSTETLRPNAQDRDVVLELQLPGSPIPARADPQALTQIVVNLVDNAIKHAPPGSSVHIGLSAGQASEDGSPVARVCVRDQGPGIPPADHVRIFEPFYRRGSELRRETAGVGLGLSIVQRLVQAHRGRIFVESAPGRGARFTVELPLPGADRDTDPRTQASAPEATPDS